MSSLQVVGSCSFFGPGSFDRGPGCLRLPLGSYLGFLGTLPGGLCFLACSFELLLQIGNCTPQVGHEILPCSGGAILSYLAGAFFPSLWTQKKQCGYGPGRIRAVGIQIGAGFGRLVPQPFVFVESFRQFAGPWRRQTPGALAGNSAKDGRHILRFQVAQRLPDGFERRLQKIQWKPIGHEPIVAHA